MRKRFLDLNLFFSLFLLCSSFIFDIEHCNRCEIRPFGSKKNGVFEEEIGLPGDPHFDVMFGFEAVLEVLDEKPARYVIRHFT